MLESGDYAYTVEELMEELSYFNPKQVVFGSGFDSQRTFFIRPIYKIVEDADEKEVYLYLGDSVARGDKT